MKYFGPDLVTWLTHFYMPFGKKVVINPSWKHSETPARIHKASPLLGEDNEEVFGELLGMSKEDIKKLEAAEIIY
jgi:crotonobetainyl-CoA:carnitine CoA-transferase CaiB-like acyl-CoA transferase